MVELQSDEESSNQGRKGYKRMFIYTQSTLPGWASKRWLMVEFHANICAVQFLVHALAASARKGTTTGLLQARDEQLGGKMRISKCTGATSKMRKSRSSGACSLDHAVLERNPHSYKISIDTRITISRLKMV